MNQKKDKKIPEPKVAGLDPYHDRVFIRPHAIIGEQKTAGGIVVPDTAKEKPITGTIVKVGPGSQDIPVMQSKEGKNVIFSKFSGTEITVEGEVLLLMREGEILSGY